MLFSERQKIVIKYRNWLADEMLKNNFHIKDDPETFLVFLEMNGYLQKGKKAENNDNFAEWIFLRTKAAKCSKCGHVQITNGEDRTKQCLIHKAIYHYCPKCGAKMKGVDE